MEATPSNLMDRTQKAGWCLRPTVIGSSFSRALIGKPAKTIEEKAALLDSMIAYTGKFTVEGDKITTHVDTSSNEIYTGANQDQTRFFRIDGNKLIIQTPEIVSAVRPGQKAVGIITFEREH